MNKIFEKIKDFFSEIADFIRRFMGPDLSESELLEGEYDNDYFYQKINAFNELEPTDRKILDDAMKDVIYEEGKMGMEEALKMAKKDKLSIKNTEKSNTKPKANSKTKSAPTVNKNEPTSKEPKNVDRDM